MGVRKGHSHRESSLSGQSSGELEGRTPLGEVQEPTELVGTINGGHRLSPEAREFRDKLAMPGVMNDAERGGGTNEGLGSPQFAVVAELKAPGRAQNVGCLIH